MGFVEGFSIFTGIASLLGLGHQFFELKDSPSRTLLRLVVFLVSGAYLGTFIATIANSSVANNAGHILLVAVTVLAAIGLTILVTYAASCPDSLTRTQIFKVSSFGMLFLIILLLLSTYTVSRKNGLEQGISKLNFDEINVLVDTNLKSSNYDRSLCLLEELRKSLGHDDKQRLGFVMGKIEMVKRLQIKAK